MKEFHFLLALLFIGLTGFKGNCQELTISNLTIDDNGIISFAALVEKDHSSRELYNLLVYHSGNDFSQPISFGKKSMVPGELYKLNFDALQEVGRYEGNLQLRFDIKASVFPIKLISDQYSFRRGKGTTLQWEDYHKVAPYKVELVKNGETIQVLSERATASELSQVIGSEIAKGDDYVLHIKSLVDDQYNADPIPIVVKGKYGPGVKIGPAAGVAGVVTYLICCRSGSTQPFANPPASPGN